VQVEQLPGLVELLVGGALEIEPEEPVELALVRDLVGLEVGEDEHAPDPRPCGLRLEERVLREGRSAPTRSDAAFTAPSRTDTT
jgi:hypothetical protein